MTSSKVCRLCLTSASIYSQLYDENGFGNQLYDLSMEYFHPKIVDMNKAKHLKEICEKCHRIIWDFYKFQEFLLESQSKKLNDYLEEIHIKIEPYNGTLDKSYDDRNSNCNSPKISIDREEQKISSEESKKRAKHEDDITIFNPKESVEGKPTHTTAMIKEEVNHETIASKDSMVWHHGTTVVIKKELNEREPSSTGDDSYVNIAQEELHITDVPIKSEEVNTDEDENFLKQSNNDTDNSKLEELLAKWMPIIKCVYCPASYAEMDQVQEHIKTYHPGEDFYIKCCSRKLRDSHAIASHLRLHNNPDAYKCQQCGLFFSDRSYLRSHMIEKHGLHFQFKCDTCSKSFEHEIGLQKHINAIHKKDTRMKPDIQTASDGTTIYICRECGKSFKSSGTFRCHRYTVHLLKADHECEICKKMFKTKKHLREHMLTHDSPHRGGKSHEPIPCTKCTKICYTEYALNRHMQTIHSPRNQPTQCKICNKVFGRKDLYRRHMRSMHEKKYVYQCVYCPLTSATSSSIVAHRKAKHPNESTKNSFRRIPNESSTSCSSIKTEEDYNENLAMSEEGEEEGEMEQETSGSE